MRIGRSTVYKFAIFAAFSFLIGFSYNYHLPRIESFLLVEIEQLSRKHSPVRVWAKNLSFHLIPLGVVLEDIKVVPQAPLDKYLAPAQLKVAGARLALLPLLRGEVRLSQIFIRDSEVSVFLKSDLFDSKKDTKSFKFNFDQIYNLPIDEFHLENVQIQGRLDPQNVVFKIADLNLTVENRYRSLFVETAAPKIMVKPSGPVDPLHAQLDLRALIEERELQISAFKLKADESFLVASGRFNGDFSQGRVDNGAFDARAKVNLPDLNVWEKVFFLKPRIPALQGRAETDIGIELRKGQDTRVEVDLETDAVKVAKFFVGQVKTKASSNLKTITSDEIRLENNSGVAKIQKLKLELEPERKISMAVKVEKIQLKEFLMNLGIKKVPVTLPIVGEADCTGVWNENPLLECKASTSLAHGTVHGEKKGSTIAAFENARARGDLRVTLKQVDYRAEIELGKESKGRSNGVIDYDKGFTINYEADRLLASEIKNIADLKFEGEVKLTGNTIGTSDWATIHMDADGKDLWLEDYPLGRATAAIDYKSGNLIFSNVQGQYQVSRFNGGIGIDLRNSRIKIDGQVPFIDLKDVQAMFQRKITLPVQASGTGTGQIHAEGPLRFSEMSYQVNSEFFRGQMAGETFDQMTFQVRSVDGLVKTQKFQLTKSNGVVDVNGQINPKGEIDAVVVGRNMRLEQSENVIGLGFDLQGLADFTVLVRGQLPKPRIELNGRLSRVVLGDRPAEDSVFKLNFLPDRMEGSGQFLGSTLISDFVLPYDDQAPFNFKLKARQWDFTTLFSLVSKSAQQLDFTTSVTADINLHAPQGGFWASTGQVKIDELIVRKGAKKLAAERPMLLLVKQGVINSNDFTITSGDSYLKLDVSDLSKERLNATLNGKLDLSLLGLFTPFISDLRGNMAISMALKGQVSKPAISGSAYVEKAYVKLNDMPHPFSNGRADVLFNDNQILINAVRADLAGGKVAGDGKITFNGDNRPVDVRGTFTDVKINIPENFHTQGSGMVAITGNGFPYLMDIKYDVTGGEVTYEIGEGSDGQASVQASAYLPKFLYQDVFHPFYFQIETNLKQPVLVNNSLINTNVTGQVTAKGTPDRLILTGGFTPLPGGKVLFRDVPFDITSAYVEYDGVAPDRAKIYLTASAQVTEISTDDQQRNSEHQYDVNLLVQGRGRNAEILLTSSPALSQREIVSLLALGVTSGNRQEEGVPGAQAATTSTAIGAALIQKASGNRLKKSLGVDVKVSTSQQTTENAASPKVTLSKQWTPKFSASASSTLQASPNNNVKLEYKMNRNVSVVGSWDAKETLEDQKDTSRNVFGLDLEYKLKFK